MNSAESSRQQAVFVISARGWLPERGIHRGIECEECGEAKPVMYRGRTKVLCRDCAAAVTPLTGGG